MAPKYPFIARGKQKYNVLRSVNFNIDNGSGTTVDDVLGNFTADVQIISVKAVYVEATDTAGAASANFKVGVTAGGATLVGATALQVSKAVGATTTGTILVDSLAAGTSLFVRHTGIAATEAGQYYVQVEYQFKP
jgi:hypothetical protein